MSCSPDRRETAVGVDGNGGVARRGRVCGELPGSGGGVVPAYDKVGEFGVACNLAGLAIVRGP